MAAGVGAKALLSDLVPPTLASLTASVLLLFSGCCFAAGVWRVWQPGVPPPPPDIRPLPMGLLVVMNGFLLAITIVALVGLWLVRV